MTDLEAAGARGDAVDEDEEPEVDDGAEGGVVTWLVEGPGQWIALGLVLLLTAGAAGYWLAGWQDRPPGRGSVDVGFLYDMIAHHEQAVSMGNVEDAVGAEPRARTFAREVVLFQSYEIGRMEQKLRDWGYERSAAPSRAMEWMSMGVAAEDMPGLASKEEMDRLLEVSGRDADALFVALMIDHHRGGLHMAQYAARHAADADVRDLAEKMAISQQSEINEMEAARKEMGLPENPPGYTRF